MTEEKRISFCAENEDGEAILFYVSPVPDLSHKQEGLLKDRVRFDWFPIVTNWETDEPISVQRLLELYGDWYADVYNGWGADGVSDL